MIADGVPELDRYIDQLLLGEGEQCEKQVLDTELDVSRYLAE